MTGARASFARPTLAGLLGLVGLLALLAIGCGSDDTTPTFPDQPAPEPGLWFLGVWGSGPDDVFVVGQPGLIYHWDGAAWSREESGTTVALTDVWGDGSGTVYATGHDGVILRRQGGSWSAMASGTDADLFGIGNYQGTIYACGRTDELPALRRLAGGSWSAAANEIFVRDAEQAVSDTIYLDSDDDPSEIIESLTSVSYYGVTGADGVILMADPETDWQLRRVLGGSEWITCSSSAERITGNFIATDGGHLFQLRQSEDELLAWQERYSPALGATVYGVYVDLADTVWVCTDDGRINRVDPDNSFHPLYAGGKLLFDIWGSSGTDLYAVGIEGRVLHFTDIGGEYQWVEEELPLPELKSHAQPVFDKFGRPVH
ncbi:MAG: hypothetical protein R3D98_08325 [Candidatus Krumholzibacteriia bacterium]